MSTYTDPIRPDSHRRQRIQRIQGSIHRELCPPTTENTGQSTYILL